MNALLVRGAVIGALLLGFTLLTTILDWLNWIFWVLGAAAIIGLGVLL